MSSGQVTLKPNAKIVQQVEAAEADRADTGIENLVWNLLEFLFYVVRKACRVGEGEAPSNEDDYEDTCCQKIVEWSRTGSRKAFYNEPALLLHKQMYDIMSRDKEGLEKELTCYEWCRRVRKHAEPARSGSLPALLQSMLKQIASKH